MSESQRNPYQLIRILTLVTFVLIAYVLIFSEHGYLNQRRFYREIALLQEEVERLEGENREIKSEIENLRSNPVYIEMIAREELGYQYEGEQPIRVIHTSDSGPVPH